MFPLCLCREFDQDLFALIMFVHIRVVFWSLRIPLRKNFVAQMFALSKCFAAARTNFAAQKSASVKLVPQCGAWHHVTLCCVSVRTLLCKHMYCGMLNLQ